MLPIIKYKKIWFIFSGTLIVASILSLVIWRLNFGIDFTGGSLLEVRWKGDVAASNDVRSTLDPLLDRDFVVQQSDAGTTIVRMEPVSEDKHQEIVKVLKDKLGDFDELRFDSIGPVIGQELARKSIWALIIVFVSIIIYIAFTFRKVSRPVSSWKYGALTVFTAFHDSIIPLGLFSVLGHFYGTEVNAAFVAAILTILGYSINDTIVVFDRTRENLSRGTMNFTDTVETSVNQTIARSLNTTFTTLLALVAVFFFGGPSVKDFALALIAGIATGAYSSIFIASPLLVVWQRKT